MKTPEAIREFIANGRKFDFEGALRGNGGAVARFHRAKSNTKKLRKGHG